MPRTRAAGHEVPPAGLLAQQGSVGNAVVLQMLRGAGYPWAGGTAGTGGAGVTGEQDAPHVQRSAVHDVLRGPGRPLDGALRAEMESRLGADFSDVRVHDESAARASAAEIGAHAYTSGNHIVLGSGGVDRHTLAHELTHVIQQRRGRVSGQDNGAGLRVSDPSDRFEREAESTASRVMAAPVPTVPASPEPAGSAVSDARRNGAPVQRAVPATGGTPVIQRKSRFSNITPRETNAPLPVDSLHSALEKYFREVGLPEQYFFAALGLVRAADYRSGFHRAGAVTAEIDPASHRKADGSNRDNGVIGPYGHFGVMERAIFGRQNLGNTYDGGHLVEHTLMEARDADVHGNIAPQENKNFNQGLMRGWESIPEELMRTGQPFRYRVEVSYSSDTYQRTGQQLVAAGIIPGPVHDALARTPWPADPTLTLADLLYRETVSFQRWVPTRWVGTVAEPTGAALPTLTLTKGAHFRNLHGSQADAMNGVVDPTAHALVTNSGVPGLLRQNSGTLGGFIETAAVTNTGLLSVGGAPSVSAYMYQPEPQDLADQPTATTTPAGAAPAQLPASNIVVNALPHQLSLAGLYQDLMSIETKKRKRPGGELTNENKAAGTIDQEAKNASTGFRTLRTLFGKAEDGKKLVLAIRGHDANTTFGHGAFIDAISRANLNKAFYRTLTQLGYDPNLVA